jgi:hypothetical protein
MAKRKRLNRNEVIMAIARLDDFTSHTGSMRGERQGDIYVVLSYNQPIGECNGRCWNLNSNKYSVTTSRHQSYLRRGVAYYDASHPEI